MKNELELLLNKMADINSYPEKMKSINYKEGIKGIGFFPGARGLYDDNDFTVSNKCIMVLGQDFGGERSFNASIQRDEESQNQAMWKNLLHLLNEAELKYRDCFFTNAIMGIRTEGSAIGSHIWTNHEIFKNECLAFLRYQITVQKPRTILVLGLSFLPLLTDLFTEVDYLKSVKSFKDFSPEKPDTLKGVKVKGISNYDVNVGIIMHPSYRHLNIKHRNYRGLKANEAEVQLLKDLTALPV